MDFKDLGGVTLEKLDAYIKLCDAVVHLVGDLTGPAACNLSTEAILCKYPGLPRKFPPLGEVLEKGEPISYTQWEAWLALYHSKVLLIAKATRACLCACGPGSRGPTFAKPSRACALSREKPLEIARGHCLRRSLAAPWSLSSPCAGRCNISSLRGGRARFWISSAP
jgi:hypothetical protein